MYHPRRLRRLSPPPYSPLPHLIRPRREKTSQLQRLAHRENNFRQRALRAQALQLLLFLPRDLEAAESFFQGDGDGDDGVAGGVGFHPLGDLGEVLVLLADVVALAEVDEVDDGFCGEEEEGVDYFDLDTKIEGGRGLAFHASGRFGGMKTCEEETGIGGGFRVIFLGVRMGRLFNTASLRCLSVKPFNELGLCRALWALVHHDRRNPPNAPARGSGQMRNE